MSLLTRNWEKNAWRADNRRTSPLTYEDTWGPCHVSFFFFPPTSSAHFKHSLTIKKIIKKKKNTDYSGLQSGWYLTLNVSPTVTTQGGPDWTFSLRVGGLGWILNHLSWAHRALGNGGVSSGTAALYAPQTPRGIHGGEPRALVTTGAAFESRLFHMFLHTSLSLRVWTSTAEARFHVWSSQAEKKKRKKI